MNEIIQMAIAAAGGGGVTGAVVTLLVKHYLAQQRDRTVALVEKVDRLENERLKKMEAEFNERVGRLHAKVENHLGADNSQRVMALLETVLTRLDKFESNITRVLEQNADQERHLCALDLYVANLDKSIQSQHRR